MKAKNIYLAESFNRVRPAMPRVLSVHSSPSHRFSKEARSSIRLISGVGVFGDAHAGELDQHRYHVKKFGAQPNLRQVHLLPAELFATLAHAGYEIRPGELGENICTQGIDCLSLPERTRLHVGATAVVELTGLRNPCSQINKFTPGLASKLVEKSADSLIRRAGVMGIVVRDGTVDNGEGISVELLRPPLSPLIYLTPKRLDQISQ